MPTETENTEELVKMIPQKTAYTMSLHPNYNMKMKLKMNVGLTTFKQTETIMPLKFDHDLF